MIHIRIDNEAHNDRRIFACGLGPELPEGDTYFWAGEAGALRADCPVCNPSGLRHFGTPISELSGQSGHPGYEEFCRIAATWGHD